MSPSPAESSRLSHRGSERAGGSEGKRIELVAQAQRGDVLALDRVLDELLPLVTRICLRLAGARWEDARQDALVLIFHRLGTLEQPGALFSWAATIARREALRYAGPPTAGATHSEPSALAGPSAADLHQVLATLPTAYCEVLLLRDLVGLGERETATLLGLPTGTVKSRLHRAREAFRKAWGE